MRLAHTVAANTDAPRVSRRKRLPVAQLSAESNAIATAKTLALPSTVRAISTTPIIATARPPHWARVARSFRKRAASTSVNGPWSWTRTAERPGGRPACMAKKRKTNWPPNRNAPMPASAFHDAAGLGMNSTGSAPRMKRQAAKANGVNSSRPKRMTVKFSPQIAAISSDRAMWTGFNLQPNPGARGLVRRLPGLDLVLVGLGLGDIVETGQHRVLSPRIDLERDGTAGRRDHHAVLEIDRHARVAGRGLHLVGQLLDVFDRQWHRQDAVLEAVVVEDVAEVGRDHRLDAHALQRPHRAFAGGAAAEVLSGQDDRRVAVGLLVEDAVGIFRTVRLEADLLEGVGAKTFAADVVDQPLDADDEIGVDVLAHQRRGDAGHLGELVHRVLLELADVGDGSLDRGGRGHGGAGEMGARAGALAAHEVAVGGRDAALAGRHALAVRRKAHRAAGLAPFEARVEEHLVEAFGLGLFLDALGARHDPRRHMIGLVPSPGDFGGGAQVGDATVRA